MGVVQVTAAHEVLHAVYARLSDSQRTTLDSELQDYYEHGLTNTLVKNEVKLYQQTEPHDVYDEMSCTFGTEIASLPPDLEAYYNQYFANRSAIVAYEQDYQAAFSSRQAVITQDDAQLGQMRAQINSENAQLKTELDQLNSQLNELTTQRSAGDITDYNAGVPGYNDAITTYNNGVTSLQNLITQYNQLVATRNQVAGVLTTLDSAIDTRTTPSARPSQ
jgi:chromosome segregation ATPase